MKEYTGKMSLERPSIPERNYDGKTVHCEDISRKAELERLYTEKIVLGK